MILGFAKYSKMSNETQIRYTLKHHGVLISRGVKMVVHVAVSTGWAFAVNHPFNIKHVSI